MPTSRPAVAASDVDLETLTHQHVLETYRRHSGNKARTARALGIGRRTLYRLLEEIQHWREGCRGTTNVNSSRQPWHGVAQRVVQRRHTLIAMLALVGTSIHLALRFAAQSSDVRQYWPLWTVLLVGGVPLTVELLLKLFRREFGSDLLAGISIATAVLLEEYLAGSLVVLMLSGGEALEAYAVRSASKVLEALARRMPSVAHRREQGSIVDVDLNRIRIGDELVVFPHEVCPVDGTVTDGRSAMDESYLTGEPYVLSKVLGSEVLSGAINGDGALTVRASKLPTDSRYAKIVQVMRQSEQQRPRLRRLGDQLGAFYTPLALVIAVTSWVLSGESVRFLAVLVVATPCPLLIAIPVAIIGAISLAARRGIIVKDPAALETISNCSVAIFDKTGTLTYGRPQLVEIITDESFEPSQVLTLAASLERYSKHPLSAAILDAAGQGGISLQEADSISELPGRGLTGRVLGHIVQITGRKGLAELDPHAANRLPPPFSGLECVVLIDGAMQQRFVFGTNLAARENRLLRTSSPNTTSVESCSCREIVRAKSDTWQIELAFEKFTHRNRPSRSLKSCDWKRRKLLRSSWETALTMPQHSRPPLSGLRSARIATSLPRPPTL